MIKKFINASVITNKKVKIKTKLFLMFSFLIITFTLFVSFYFHYLLQKALLDEIQVRSKSITQMTATSIAPAIDFDVLTTLHEDLEATYINTNIEYLVIHDINHKVIYSRYFPNARKYDYTSVQSGEISSDGLLYQTYSSVNINDRKVGDLYIGYSLAAVNLNLLKLRNSIIYLALVLLIIGLSAAYFISSVIIKPLADISKVVHDISTEDLSKRVNIESKDEIGNLAESFNNMIDQLEIASLDMKQLNISLEQKNDKLNELNATKDKFFSIIAHDLKGPLGSFMQVVTMLHENPDTFTDDERNEMLELIKNSADNVYNLLENLLEWSRSQRGKISFNPAEINIQELAKNSLSLHKASADNKNITLTNNITNPVLIYGDVGMLNTIFRNLISNAVKFTPHGGTFEIGSFIKPADSEHSKEYVQVYFRDTGVGIAPDKLTSIFSIGEYGSTEGTSGEKGTGLGLILCNEFIKYHGGKIWVESEEGKGSTFNITLKKSIE
ncbi:MAG: HAMP domain-containing sensor histidine kinase [Candidatus Kapabacteria bacterium]|nr:HAMP domain-containing sensor histidine kinase [Candidatus Kapabacteria bacterium]